MGQWQSLASSCHSLNGSPGNCFPVYEDISIPLDVRAVEEVNKLALRTIPKASAENVNLIAQFESELFFCLFFCDSLRKQKEKSNYRREKHFLSSSFSRLIKLFVVCSHESQGFSGLSWRWAFAEPRRRFFTVCDAKRFALGRVEWVSERERGRGIMWNYSKLGLAINNQKHHIMCDPASRAFCWASWLKVAEALWLFSITRRSRAASCRNPMTTFYEQFT